MKKLILTTSVALCAFLVIGCATKIGRDFNTSYISQIVRGKTTKAQVRENIGIPKSVTTTSAGEMWLYQQFEGGNYFENMGAALGMSELKSKHKSLTITFDGNLVKDFSYTKGD